MADEAPDFSGDEAAPRPPTLTDLARLCAEFNRLGARYVVVGGLAIIQAGYSRTTEDIDLLIDATPENEARIIEGLLILPDKAARQLNPGDIARYTVIRVADDVLVDLMKNSCGVTYAEAIKDALTFDVQGVLIPFASPGTLWRMKQTVRAKDIPDRLYLRELLHAQGIEVEAAEPEKLSGWIQRRKAWWQKDSPS
ncbi:MAG: hypothetical protein L0Z50_33980 [Verrucomicrobiales bacterium]|nr:hypothetical protein [Verrucomicrobiales bacterium]